MMRLQKYDFHYSAKYYILIVKILGISLFGDTKNVFTLVLLFCVG